MKLKDGIIIQDIGDEMYLIDSRTSSEAIKGIIRLNETGAEIALLLENDISEEQIASRLLEKYGSGEDAAGIDELKEKIADDVPAFIENLRSHGLIEE